MPVPLACAASVAIPRPRRRPTRFPPLFPLARPQPLSVQAAPSSSGSWSRKQKTLTFVGLAVLFAGLLALVISYRGSPPTTADFRGGSECFREEAARRLACVRAAW